MPLTEEQLAQFPETVREWDEVKNSDSVDVVWDRLSNMRKKIGTGLYAPGEDAGDDDKARFLTKAIEISDGMLMPRPDLDDEEARNNLFASLGRPEDPNGYEFAEIEGSSYDDERKQFIAQAAHEVGLTKKQLKQLDEKLRTAEVEQVTKMKSEVNGKLLELKQEWGLAFEERNQLARKVVDSFFPNAPENLTAGELQAFYKIGKQLMGTGHEIISQGAAPEQDTPSEARAKIAEIRNNPDHPYFHHDKPGHEEARMKMRSLYKQAHGIQ